MAGWYGWVTGSVGVGGLDHDQILWFLAEREAACQAEVFRLEQEAARWNAARFPYSAFSVFSRR